MGIAGQFPTEHHERLEVDLLWTQGVDGRVKPGHDN
jgi:hypothetical protein